MAALRGARHVFALAGAGLSAESGIPTFRDAQTGLWARYRPEDLATPAAFRRDPQLVWRWYQWRRELVRRAAPNAGHRALAEMAAGLPRMTLVTQNVDGLQQRAGGPQPLEFHGSLLRDRCDSCGRRSPAARDTEPPRCPQCGASLRPDVVWFGEAIPEDALRAAFAAAQDCDLFTLLGTSATVYPAAGLAETARTAGARLVEINPAATPFSRLADFRLQSGCATALPQLARAVRAR